MRHQQHIIAHVRGSKTKISHQTVPSDSQSDRRGSGWSIRLGDVRCDWNDDWSLQRPQCFLVSGSSDTPLRVLEITVILITHFFERRLVVHRDNASSAGITIFILLTLSYLAHIVAWGMFQVMSLYHCVRCDTRTPSSTNILSICCRAVPVHRCVWATSCKSCLTSRLPQRACRAILANAADVSICGCTPESLVLFVLNALTNRLCLCFALLCPAVAPPIAFFYLGLLYENNITRGDWMEDESGEKLTTAFSDFYGSMKVVPFLGRSFNTFFPVTRYFPVPLAAVDA